MDVNCEVMGIKNSYGFEYQGNNPRIVITPLTERTQRSLVVALHNNFGGAPEGPVGTGKTETTKDLGRQLARLCIVQNCSARFEYESIVRFFKGISFPEFTQSETFSINGEFDN